MDWQSVWRDFSEQPAAAPLLGLYYNFMSIRRGDRFPFYIYPAGKPWMSFEDTFITFLDWAIDAHELERNKSDVNRSFYQRSVYFYENFLRYNNQTVANCMFDAKLPKNKYDRLNTAVDVGNLRYLAATSAFHTLGFMYLAYFFRFRKVGFVPAFGIACAYYYGFTKVNNAAYKWVVDRPVLAAARDMGLEQHVQPQGHSKNRGLNFQ